MKNGFSPVKPGLAKVLFLCRHNSAPRQMAEGLANSSGKGNLQAFSTGSEPTSVNHYAIKVMSESNYLAV